MICENCGRKHDGSYGSGRFCSKECAKSFSSKNINYKEVKKANCILCGKELFINKMASLNKCKCPDCANSKVKKCSICGNLYQSRLGCQNEFCKKHNYQQFKSLIKYFGFDKNKLGTNEVEKEFNRIRTLLYNEYWVENHSSSEICKKYNYPNAGNLTAKVFKYLNIISKTNYEANHENYLLGRIKPNVSPIYKQQWYTTWNNKEVYLHSSYELDYAKELDKQKVNYEVENLRIKYFDSQKQEYRCAIPDFYIPSENLIVEIKSEYTLDKQNMMDKKKAYLDLGYNFKLICDHKELEL